MLPVNRPPVAITSGKVTDWRMKSAKELFKTCYIWALVQQQLSPIQGCVCVCCDATKSPIFSCLCLVPTTISFHIFHLITSVFLFISLVQLSLCSLHLNRTEPVSCGFVSLSHTLSTLHFILPCTALCIILLVGLKDFSSPEHHVRLQCFIVFEAVRLQDCSVSLSLSLILLFVCSEHFTRLRSLNCLWQPSIQSHKYSMKRTETEPLCIHVHITRVKLAIIEAKTFLDVTFQLCV